MTFGDRLDQLLEPAEPVRALVAAYFDPAKGFAGVTFDNLGRTTLGEDSDSTRSLFTADDLLAVTLLDVRWNPPAVRALLSDPNGAYGSALNAVPTDDVWSTNVTDADFVAADLLYAALCSLSGVARTRATKVMARKRPRFVPIVDEVIKTALLLPDDWKFQWWQEVLAVPERRDRIEGLRPDGVHVSLLRLIDVALWMRCSRSEAARHEQAVVGLG